MYIQVSIDLKKYNREVIDLRLSNHTTISRLIDIVWQVAEVEAPPQDGDWVRIVNNEKVSAGSATMKELGLTSGDKIEIL